VVLRYAPRVRRTVPLVLAVISLSASGCTGIELSAPGVAALSAGTGSVVRAGTEYTLTGSAYRTFSLSREDLSTAVRSTLARVEFTVQETFVDDHELVIETAGIARTVQLRFTPITPVMTRLKVVVRHDLVRRDRATASELLAQIDRDAVLLSSTTEPR
jgi:hypothetical protein